MNSMTTAMAQAGIPLPSKMECLWKIVKDNPNISAKTAGQKAKLTMSSASSLMSQLESRGMVTSKTEVRRIKLGQGVGTRDIKVFTVTRGMEKYELLPMPPKKATKATVTVTHHAAPKTHHGSPSMAEAKPAQPKMTLSFAEVFMLNHSTLIDKLHAIEPKMDLQTMQVSTLLQICAKHGIKITLS